MSADQIVLLAVGLIVIAAVAVTVAYATAHATRGGVASVAPDPATSGLRDHDDRATDPITATATGTIRTGSTCRTGRTRRAVGAGCTLGTRSARRAICTINNSVIIR